jgi:hypothetical protein
MVGGVDRRQLGRLLSPRARAAAGFKWPCRSSVVAVRPFPLTSTGILPYWENIRGKGRTVTLYISVRPQRGARGTCGTCGAFALTNCVCVDPNREVVVIHPSVIHTSHGVSLLDGLYQTVVPVHGVIENGVTKHRPYFRNYFDVLKEQGYHTALIGKTHFNPVPPNRLTTSMPTRATPTNVGPTSSSTIF